MSEQCLLIVNADDFGLSRGINAGIIRTIEDGIVTSASLMVRGKFAAEAAEYANSHPQLSVGLHIDLGEWRFHDGSWLPRYSVVPLDDEQLVRSEIARQLDEFRQLIGSDPTHIDSHQHVHREGIVLRVAGELANQLQVPLRHCNRAVHYCGDFYGQPYPGQSLRDAVSVEALQRAINTRPTGITELACHPGLDQDFESDYSVERQWEVSSLCSPDVKAATSTQRVALRSFRSSDVQAIVRGAYGWQ